MARIPYVYQDECTACGFCEETCSEVFQLNEDGIAEVYHPEGASEDEPRMSVMPPSGDIYVNQENTFHNIQRK